MSFLMTVLPSFFSLRSSFWELTVVDARDLEAKDADGKHI